MLHDLVMPGTVDAAARATESMSDAVIGGRDGAETSRSCAKVQGAAASASR